MQTVVNMCRSRNLYQKPSQINNMEMNRKIFMEFKKENPTKENIIPFK